MAKPIRIEIKGVNKAMKYLMKKNVNIERAVEKSINTSALMLTGEVKESIAGHKAEPTSVDTGRFLNSVDNRMVAQYSAEVFSPLEYAIYLEYGTSRIQARRHFNNSKDRTQNAIIGIINTAVKLATK